MVVTVKNEGRRGGGEGRGGGGGGGGGRPNDSLQPPNPDLDRRVERSTEARYQRLSLEDCKLTSRAVYGQQPSVAEAALSEDEMSVNLTRKGGAPPS